MSDPRPFAHLHCHTHYSLLDGANRIPDLVAKVKAAGMNAVAITDHGNLFGAIEFYNACRASEVNPIIGYEAYVAPGRRIEKKATRMKEASFHLTLLAMNRQGFQNLVRMASIAYLEGFYYKPRIDKELLEEHNEGLICLSGCAAAELSQLILAGRMDEAKKLVAWYEWVFGDRFYLEIQNAGLDIQKECADGTIDIARAMGLPLVATNDAHYLNQTDAGAHDVLLCVNTRSQRSDANRMQMQGSEFFVRTPDEMYAAFPEHADAVARTQEIAERVDIQLDLGARHFPVFTPPQRADSRAAELASSRPTEYLRELCEEGLKWRYGDAITDVYRERLDYELSVIERMGYSSYFLIVWDFVRFAGENKIPCQARGSACGALVAYVLGLSNVCPLEYDLLFERFLDPSRTEPPDIDIDFCRDRRQLVIDYTKQKYGEQNVAQIGTFGTLRAKAAIRDVGRALGVPLPRVDEICKSVPDTLNIKLKDALAESPELKDAYDQDPQVRELIDIALLLEGLARSAGTHAAGVVVADRPLSEYVPLQTITGKDDIVTQWDGPTVEQIGLLKMDFLGLRNLTILDKAVQNVKKHRGIEIDPVQLPLDDAETYALLQRGETKGIFQLESGGMRDLLTKMRPDCFNDIIATSALYRPGPLEGGMVMDYVNVKHGRQAPRKIHPAVDEVLKETYGVMVYQEQVMRILNRVGGIELPAAYRCIKAISKKKLKTIAEFREQYIEGAKQNGIDERTAIELFELIEKFAGYGFNKCLVGSTTVIDANTGGRTTVDSLFRDRRPFTIHSLGEDGKLSPRNVTDVMWNGRKAVFTLRTAQGWRLTATANHPLRTLNGWTNLGELKPGNRIATPRRLTIASGISWPQHEVIALAGLLSEGNTCHPTCLYFYNDTPALIDDFVEAISQFPNTVARVDQRRDGRRLEVCVSTGRDTRFQKGQKPWNAGPAGDGLTAVAAPIRVRSGAFKWAHKLGLLRRTATEKKLPPDCFLLCDDDLELFLGRLWAGDGFVGSAGQMPFYATSSAQLARDVQILLLRLGITSGVHYKVFDYRHNGTAKKRDGYTVHLIGDASIEAFVRRVLPHALGREEQVQRFREYLATIRPNQTSKDTIPAEVREWVDEERRRAGLTWRELEQRSGVCMREFCNRRSQTKRGFRRSTLAKLAEFFSSRRLVEIADSDILWDTIVSIERKGIQDTYDLTVEGDHNFVADGLIVHNSHSTAYGAVAYQTAYLKAHYPYEFMAALLSCGMESSDRIAEHVDDCRRMGIEVLPPDVNRSDVEFSVHGERLTFGLGAIKGVGEQAMAALVEEREANGPFTSIFDLAERVDPKHLNRNALEILIKAGALDGLGPNRAQHMLAVERAVQSAIALHRDKALGQKSLFGGDELPGQTAAAATLPEAPDWTHGQTLGFEKEVLGFYLTSHPLTQHAAGLQKYATHTTSQLAELDDKAEVLVAGMISSIKKAATKKPSRGGHSRYANFDLEDPEGIVRCIIWPEQFARQGDKVKAEAMCFVKGKVDRRGREPNVIVDQIYTPDEAEKEFTRQLAVKFQRGLHDEGDMARVRDLLYRFPGRTEVVVVIDSADETDPSTRLRYVMTTPATLRVSCTRELRDALNDAVGEDHFRLHPFPKKTNGHAARNGNGQRALYST